MSQHCQRKFLPNIALRGTESKPLSLGPLYQSVMNATTTGNLPDYVPEKRVVNSILRALGDSNIARKEGNIPSMAREREIVGAIRQTGTELPPLRRLYTVEERKVCVCPRFSTTSVLVYVYKIYI